MHKLIELFAVLTHIPNGLLARATVQLFVPIHLLRKRMEEAVAVPAHVHCLPTVGLEIIEATTQLGTSELRLQLGDDTAAAAALLRAAALGIAVEVRAP